MNQGLIPGMGARETAPPILGVRDVMVIAQSPGRYVDPVPPMDEWPLVRKLDQWFVQAGFPSEMHQRVYMTNAYPYHVDGLTSRMLQSNVEWMKEQIDRVDPLVIVCLGGAASDMISLVSGHRKLKIGETDSVEVPRVGDRGTASRFVIVFPHTSGRSRVTNTEEGRAAVENAVRWLSWSKTFFKLSTR